MFRIILALGLLGLLAACGGAPEDDSTTTTSSPMLECFYEECEPPPPPPPPPDRCETAFGYGGECVPPVLSMTTNEDPPPPVCVEPYSECFLELGFSRWGWTIALPDTLVGTLSLELWAGAAQCETWRGTKVGTVDVYCNAYDDLVVEFEPYGYVDLDETHLYFGPYEVPKVGAKQKETVAPGQYPYNEADGEYVIPDGCEDLPGYLIAHAVACWNDEDPE